MAHVGVEAVPGGRRALHGPVRVSVPIMLSRAALLLTWLPVLPAAQIPRGSLRRAAHGRSGRAHTSIYALRFRLHTPYGFAYMPSTLYTNTRDQGTQLCTIKSMSYCERG
jgi:hypothetical protein